MGLFGAEGKHTCVKPEYVYQPRRLFGRLIRRSDRASPTAVTAFGLPLDIMPDELISNSIRRKGIYDIVTAEAIFRLLDPKAHALDVGAHVGLMSAIMALRVGAGGLVQSFEPHPAIFTVLQANAARVNKALGSSVIRTQNVALSDTARRAQLFLPGDWATNTGVGRLDAPQKLGSIPVSVECQTLDDVTLGDKPELMKLDVEGHELRVLRGASRTLEKVRDIVFEDFGAYPTPTMLLLEQSGFRIFALSRKLSRPILAGADRRDVPKKADPNYLATRDPERACARFKSKGWNVLRGLF
jgi:FkbM family methyltransferase